MTETMFDRLAAEFPRSAISWRAQSITKDGDKAMALAYIDARDVMDRLDEVVGPENWSDSYDVHPNVTICTIAIRTAEGWVSKADGAGDTDVEAEKGRISDALKRAAVRWGIGRYLYAMSSPWVPCLTAEYNGKKVFKKWNADPWDFVKTPPASPQNAASGHRIELAASAAQGHWTAIASALSLCTTRKQLAGEWSRHEPVFNLFSDSFQDELKQHFLAIRETLPVDPADAKKLAAAKSVEPDFSKLEQESAEA